MNKVMDVESKQLVAVLEETVAALELAAMLPDSAHAIAAAALAPAATRTLEGHAAIEAAVLADTKRAPACAPYERPEVDECTSEHSTAFPASLHCVLQLLARDKTARDALRLASATHVTPDFARFVLAWTQLVMHVELALSTSPEQDERAAASVRESKLRLREAEDDVQQVAFELAQERDAHVAMTERFAKTIAALQEQLKDTQQRAAEALAATERGREQDLHTALSAFENQSTAANEKALAVARIEARASDENKQLEAEERKRKQRVGTDVYELLARYDDEMEALDDAIAAEQCVLQRIECATASLVSYFARVDEDRRNQLDEVRAIEDAVRRRRQRELNLFRFVQRLQAVVRGFLVRRQYRLQLQAQKARRRKKKQKKKTGTGTAKRAVAVAGSKTGKRASASAGRSPRKPTPPDATVLTKTKVAARPASGATGRAQPSSSSKSPRKPTQQ